MLNPIRSLMTKVQERRTLHKTEKAKKQATHTPKKELFAANGWGPRSAFENRTRAYKGPLYPSPDYAAFARNKSRPLCSEEAQAKCNTARRLWWAGDLDNAKLHYRKAIRRSPDNAELHFEYAQLLWATTELTEARHYVDKALALKPDFVAARVSHIRLTQKIEGTVSNDEWDKFVEAEDVSEDVSTHNALAEMFPVVASEIRPG